MRNYAKFSLSRAIYKRADIWTDIFQRSLNFIQLIKPKKCDAIFKNLNRDIISIKYLFILNLFRKNICSTAFNWFNNFTKA